MEAQSPSPNGVAIEVKGISKRFGALLAVDNVSFTVQAGEIFGLLGPNGAGKSTLIRMLTTLVPPTSGTAMVAGHDIIHDPNAVRANIGVIPQNMTSDPELTCAENLGIHARLYGITGARRRHARPNCSKPSVSPTGPTPWRPRFRAACAGGLKLPAGWCTIRNSCSWTSPPPASTRPRAFRFGR